MDAACSETSWVSLIDVVWYGGIIKSAAATVAPMWRGGVPSRVKLGTRGSDLALEQTRRVEEALPYDYEVESVVVETSGDSFGGDIAELGTQGAFVRELDLRVVDGELDGAVHSMKDMPTERPDGLEVAAVLERAPEHDVLVTPDGAALDELEEGATVGTSSRRRRAQFLRERGDLNVERLRGNVDTRVEKVAEGDYDGAVLSEAGIDRLNLDAPYTRLPLDGFTPSANQGIVAVVAVDGTDAFDRLAEADHKGTRVVATAERIVLSRVGGGCIAPIGVHARVEGDRIRIRADALSDDGEESVNLDRRYDVESYIEGAREMAGEMLDRGADELIREASG
jgi:hydroxymethylbilane synthase